METSISDDLDAWVELGSSGRFALGDSLNVISGEYTRVPDGIRIDHAVTTLVGYVGDDPTRLALIRAVAKMTRAAVVIELRMESDSLVMAAAGHTLTCVP